jgi:hypothetical protein
MTITRENEIKEIWREIEYHGEAWKKTWKIVCPAIPLHQLQPYWNSLASKGAGPLDLQKQRFLEHENAVLQQEVHYLKRKLEEATGAIPLTLFDVEKQKNKKKLAKDFRS